MSNSIKYVTKVVILIVYILIIFFILHHHYVEAGECAARVYYIPLGRWDYILISLIGIIMLFLSRYIITTSKKFRALEILIYASLITATLILGNDILASRTIDWPETYKVKPLKWSLKVEQTVELNLTIPAFGAIPFGNLARFRSAIWRNFVRPFGAIPENFLIIEGKELAM